MDVGVVGEPGAGADITREEVAAPVMAASAMKLVSRLAEEDKAHGIVAMGGTQGTTLALERERDHLHTSCTLDKWYIDQLSPPCHCWTRCGDRPIIILNPEE